MVMTNNPIRKLARTDYWQTLYNQAKELSINLFDNNSNFSELQITFLKWLNLYSSVMTDLLIGKEYLTEEIIDNDIDLDAYLYFRKTNKDDYKSEEKPINTSGVPSISFVPKRRKK